MPYGRLWFDIPTEALMEAVLGDGSDDKKSVDEAKESIRRLVTMIVSEEDESEKSAQAMGKLEYYLINNCIDHYDACVEAGVIGAVES